MSHLEKQDRAELWKQMVTVTGVAVATTKFLFSMCDYTIDSDVGTGDFSLVLGISHMCTCNRTCLRAGSGSVSKDR